MRSKEVIKNSAEERNEKVLEVLRKAFAPLGPTEIARRIEEPWCNPPGKGPNSAIISQICARLGLKSRRGKYAVAQINVGNVSVTKSFSAARP